MTDLKTFFADCARTVDEKLDKLIPSIQTEPQKLHESIRWSLFAGGKRFRPALCFAVGQTFRTERNSLWRSNSGRRFIDNAWHERFGARYARISINSGSVHGLERSSAGSRGLNTFFGFASYPIESNIGRKMCQAPRSYCS